MTQLRLLTKDQVMKKPIRFRIARRRAALMILLALALVPCRGFAMPASAGDTVHSLYDSLLSAMKNGRTLGQSGRFAQLEPVVHRTFDIPLMTRLSVGPTWASLTEAQRQEVAESFECGFRRSRPGIPIDVGHLFRSKSAGRSD